MAKTPIKFNRLALAFDEATREQRPCDGSSSGSEYWPESEPDLSDLVNSFFEKSDYGINLDHNFDIEINDIDEDIGDDSGDELGDVNQVPNIDEDEDDKDKKELLQSLLLECNKSNNNKKNGIKQKIWDEIEVALKLFSGNCNYSVNDASRSSLKRFVMAHLRDKGFDAGLCKSRWEKTGRFPAGTYEYIDLNIRKTRYIIEVFLAGEFEIARPTNHYTTLLEMIPSILIIEKIQVLKQLMRLMTNAMRDSLKHANMHIAPWRRNGYMQAKYVSPYKRTTNRESSLKNVKKDDEKLAMKRVGFEAHNQIPRVPYYCRGDDFGSKVNVARVGLLTSAFQDI